MDQVAAMLQELAATLGVAVDHLWSVLVYQAQLSAVLNFGWALLVVVGLTLYFKKALPWAVGCEDSSHGKKECHEIGMCLGIGVGVIGVPIVFYNLYQGVVALLNPEAIALREILRVISQG